MKCADNPEALDLRVTWERDREKESDSLLCGHLSLSDSRFGFNFVFVMFFVKLFLCIRLTKRLINIMFFLTIMSGSFCGK